jgi:small-conductance mechanosensitive channel
MNNHYFHFRHGWFAAIFFFCGALVLANVAHWILFRILRRKEVGAGGWGWGLQEHLGRPARAIFLLTCLLAVLPAIPNLPDIVEYYIRHGLFVVMVMLLGWFAVGCIYVLQEKVLRRYDLGAENNVQARRIHTQFLVFRRMLITFVVIIDAGAILWTFDNPRIWSYGSGLLASAGVASLILATAAKSTASNFLAGMQIALTQPIRIDDVVVIQGEWGKIEEITSAYVVVKIWDLRRLIVPLSYFIENSFQNWTRDASEIMGTAFLYVDYTVPVDALREQLDRIVHASHLWNGKVCGLQVTNLTDRVMEIRCLMSSRNSSENFDLRCLVREQMIAWIAENHPGAFPTNRQISTLNANPEKGSQESRVASA